MSVHSEIQNVLWNRSGDAAKRIHGRQGDTEEGDSFFDMYASGGQAPDEAAFAKEQHKARIIFLKQYFSILRSALSPEEFKFFKLKFQTKKPEKLVAAWCGVSQKKIFEKMREKLLERKDEIEDLIDESEWENAELFVRTALSSVSELSYSHNIPEGDIDDPHGDFDNVKKAQELLAIRKELYRARYDEHRTYSRGFEAGKRSAFKKRGIPSETQQWIERNNTFVKYTIHIFGFLEEMIDNGKDGEAIKSVIKAHYPFYECLLY